MTTLRKRTLIVSLILIFAVWVWNPYSKLEANLIIAILIILGAFVVVCTQESLTKQDE